MTSEKPNLKRMDNIGIVVESLDETIAFFTELGLKLEGRAMIEGAWAGRVTGLGEQRVEIAMMVTAALSFHNFLSRLSSRITETHPSTRLGIYGSCSLSKTLTTRLHGFTNTGRNLSVKSFSTRIHIDYAIFVTPKGFLLGLLKKPQISDLLNLEAA